MIFPFIYLLMDCDIMNRLMIGVEMLESQLDEERVAEYFSSVDGLEMNDDYIFSGDSKIEYFVVEKANYAVFKDINNNEFFTNHVIGFLRNLNSKDKVLVQEDDGSGRTDEEDIIFTGKVSDFLSLWDEMEGEE